jgi:hypothetical protein
LAAIRPTLDDDGVMDFVASGFVRLDAVVDPDFNRRCYDAPAGRAKELVGSAEFIREVLLHPEVSGVVRSLLGANFLVPTGGHHHLFCEPFVGQEWHSDGISGNGYDVSEIQCYYYPRDVELEDGPTIILPGTHCRSVNRDAIAHYGDIVGQLPLIVEAGTVVLTRYGIWHRAGPKVNDTPRSMIKFSYHRQTPPRRDWLCDSKEIPEYIDRPSAQYGSPIESYRDTRRRIRMWNWLCGLTEEESLTFDRWRPTYESGGRPVEEFLAESEE